jgi:hypothetical protein
LPYLDEKFRKKIVQIKRQRTEFMGEKCTMITVQDMTAFHMID